MSSAQPVSGENGVWIFRIALLEARSLTPTDLNGWSDPFCRVFMNKKKIYQTKVIKRTLNPRWNETVTYRYSGVLDGYLNFDIFDFDSCTSSEKMGSCSIPLDDPKLLAGQWCLHWYRLHKDGEIPVRGCLRLKVQMIREGDIREFFLREDMYEHEDEKADLVRRQKELDEVLGNLARGSTFIYDKTGATKSKNNSLVMSVIRKMKHKKVVEEEEDQKEDIGDVIEA